MRHSHGITQVPGNFYVTPGAGSASDGVTTYNTAPELRLARSLPLVSSELSVTQPEPDLSVPEPRAERKVPELGRVYSQALHLTLVRHELDSLRDAVIPASSSASAQHLAVVQAVWAEVVEALTGPTRADVLDVLNRLIQSGDQPTAKGLQRLEVLQTFRFSLQGNSALHGKIKSACARLRAIVAWQETEKSVSGPFMASLTSMVEARNGLMGEVDRLQTEIRAARNNLISDLMVQHDENLQAFLETVSQYWGSRYQSGGAIEQDVRHDLVTLMRTVPLGPRVGQAASILYFSLGDPMVEYALRNLKKSELDCARFVRGIEELTQTQLHYREMLAGARHEAVAKALQDNNKELHSALLATFPLDPNGQSSDHVKEVRKGMLLAWLDACHSGQVDALFELDGLGKLIDRLGAQASPPFPAEVLLKVKWRLMSPENANIIDSVKEALHRRAALVRQDNQCSADLAYLTSLKALAPKDISGEALIRDDVSIFTDFLMQTLSFKIPLTEPLFENEERAFFEHIGKALRQSSDPATVIRNWRSQVSKYADIWAGKEDIADFSKGVAQATALTRAVMSAFGEEVVTLLKINPRQGPVEERSSTVESMTKAIREWRTGVAVEPGAALYDEIQATLGWYVQLMKRCA